MKKYFLILTTTMLCLGSVPAFAQFGQMPRGSQLDGALSKLFGDNSAFSASLETQIKQSSGGPITVPARLSFDSGQVRMEMNLADAKGLRMPPNATAQMKAMGLDQMVTISQPRDNLVIIIYPGLDSYVKIALPDRSAATNDSFKVETTETGRATVDGHPCVENKAVVTDDKGVRREYTVWNATDLKNFPVKISHDEQGAEITMTFQDVSLTKPAASTFEPPAGYTKYDNMQTLMRTEIVKRMATKTVGAPPAAIPPKQ